MHERDEKSMITTVQLRLNMHCDNLKISLRAESKFHKPFLRRCRLCQTTKVHKRLPIDKQQKTSFGGIKLRQKQAGRPPAKFSLETALPVRGNIREQRENMASQDKGFATKALQLGLTE